MIDRTIGGFSMDIARLEMDDGALKYNALICISENRRI
jgi:hypothetical protein